MKTILSFCLSFLLVCFLNAQSPSIEWQKSIGGSIDDYGATIIATNDGGYITAGRTNSNNGNVTGNHGDLDYWVAKLDGNGEIEWQRCYGGSDRDFANSILNTTDGGYIVAGHTESNDGDVSFNHGLYDVWVVKIDSIGNIEWEKTYGSLSDEFANCIIHASNGDYVIAGGDGGSNNQGLIIRIRSNGDIVWEKEVGGGGSERLYSIIEDNSNRLVFAGNSHSSNIGGFAFYDYYVGVLDSHGNLLWHDRYGGDHIDKAFSIANSHSNGYIIVGESNSNDGDVTGNHGSSDYWVLNIDSIGNIIWQKSFGGSVTDRAYSIKQTMDNSYIIAGSSSSIDGDITYNNGAGDYWIIKIDQLSNIIWQNCFGGTESDIAKDICVLNSTNYIVTGFSCSNDGDVSGHHGSTYYSDYWIVKLSHETGIIESSSSLNENVRVFPNPASSILFCSVNTKSANQIKFSIFNSFGLLVQEGFIHNNTCKISISNFNSGIYFISIKSENAVYTTKFIKL